MLNDDKVAMVIKYDYNISHLMLTALKLKS